MITSNIFLKKGRKKMCPSFDLIHYLLKSFQKKIKKKKLYRESENTIYKKYLLL